MRWRKITVLSSLYSNLLAHFETLVNVADIDSFQLELLTTLLVSWLVTIASN